nr:FmdB family zinc ribbon protein [Tetrasphaera japonica]
MPTYAYACTSCDHTFEIVQSFSDDALTVCPECDGKLRKVYNAVGVVFKGSGFYRTDSRAGSGSCKGSSSKGPSDKGSSDAGGSGSGSSGGGSSTSSGGASGSSSTGSSSAPAKSTASG